MAASPGELLIVRQSRGKLVVHRRGLDASDDDGTERQLGPGRFATVLALHGGRFLIVAERARRQGVELVAWDL